MKQIALVLGGGGARGLAHIQALRAFDDLGVRPAVIAGTSIGAIMGAGFAAGLSADEIEDHVVSTFDNTSEVMARLWRLRPDSIRALFSRAPRLTSLDAERVLRVFLPSSIPDRFEQLQIPLKVTATDFYGTGTTIIEEGPLWRAIAASAALSAIFRPVIVNDRVHIDGGISSPVPFELFDPARYLVVAIDVVGKPRGSQSRFPSKVESLFGASQLLMQALTEAKLKTTKPQILHQPAVDEFRVMDFLRAREILIATKSTRDEVRQQLESLLERPSDAGQQIAPGGVATRLV